MLLTYLEAGRMGLLRMQADILCAFRSSGPKMASQGEGEADAAVPSFAAHERSLDQQSLGNSTNDPEAQVSLAQAEAVTASRAVAVSFLRLANLENDIVDRLSRYEAALWRQLAQTLFTLQAVRRR
jgi:hypothetical protein